MEFYILDSALRRDDIIHSFESFIWTERYSQYGDFEITIDPSQADKILKKQGTFIACSDSQRVMYVDFTEDALNADGKRMLTIKGKSIEAKMQERPNDYTAISTGGIASAVTLGPGIPGDIIRNLVDYILRTNPAPFDSDRMPYLQAGTWSNPSTIPEPTDVVELQSPLTDLYSSVKSVAELYKLGFRIIRPADDSKLYFEVYSGNDRTSGQPIYPAVIFSPELDTLDNYKELTTSQSYRNVAYVYAPNGSAVVYNSTADTSTAGFEKRVLIVDASDIETAAGPTLDTQLAQRGQEELAKVNMIWGFDGEIPQSDIPLYGFFYELGDLVEQRSSDGFINRMRVTEQIFVSDAEGEKKYPTLTVDSLIIPGSWDSISPSVYWDAYTTQHWDDL